MVMVVHALTLKLVVSPMVVMILLTPCSHIWTSLVVAVLLPVLALVVEMFSVLVKSSLLPMLPWLSGSPSSCQVSMAARMVPQLQLHFSLTIEI